MIDARLLDILVCPACKAKLAQQGDRLVCQSAGCGLRFPIRDDIPVMLIHEAEKENATSGMKGEKRQRRD